MEPLSVWDSYNLCYPVILLSYLSFALNNRYVLKPLTPRSARTGSRNGEWKWRNIANSFIHSFVTGCGACICFWQTPGMREDLITKFSHSSHLLVSLSTGYFCYDAVDMFLYERSKPKKYELLIHHFLVILCLSVAATQKRFLGYALVALLVEVNSIFLHSRQLLLIQRWSKGALLYRVNNSFNLGTFVVFRMLTLGWMTRWLLQHRADLTALTFDLAAVSLAVIMCMNIVLLQRILNSDFRQPRTPEVAEERLKTK